MRIEDKGKAGFLIVQDKGKSRVLGKSGTSGLGKKSSLESKAWPKRAWIREGKRPTETGFLGTHTLYPILRHLSRAKASIFWIITEMAAGVREPNGNGTVLRSSVPGRTQGSRPCLFHLIFAVSLAASFLLRWFIPHPRFSGSFSPPLFLAQSAE